MSKLFQALPLVAALIAGPAFAAESVDHAAHHPTAKAGSHAPKKSRHAGKMAAMKDCPMMDGKAHESMAHGEMMRAGEHMHCMEHGPGKDAAEAPAKPSSNGPAAADPHQH